MSSIIITQKDETKKENSSASYKLFILVSELQLPPEVKSWSTAPPVVL